MAFQAVVDVGSKYEAVWIKKVRSRSLFRPYTEPLPYYVMNNDARCMLNYPVENYGNRGSIDKQIASKEHTRCEGFSFLSSNEKNQVHNKALSKLGDKLEVVSNLFEAWYERREAYALLGSCLKAIRTFTKRWKDPNYWKQMRKTHKRNIKDPSSLPQAWLLWNFAVKPLVGTIDDVIHLLCRDMPVFWQEASSGAKGNILINTMRTVKISDSNWKGPTRVEVGESYNGQYTYIVKMGARVKTINPNEQLLNILGLTTPFSTFLSVVPWFWAVNYFVNINSLVANFEHRFPGIVIDKSYTTVFRKAAYDGKYFEISFSGERLPNGSKVYNPLDKTSVYVQHVYMNRTVGTTLPTSRLAVSYPALGSTQFANLTSAIALTMKGSTRG